MKSRPKSITMAGSVLDPETPMEDSDDSAFIESQEETRTTTSPGSLRNLMKNRKSEDGSAKKSADQDDSQKSASPVENEDTKPPLEAETAKEEITKSDPPSTSDVEKGNAVNGDLMKTVQTDESLPLVHLGSPKGRKSKESSSSFQKTTTTPKAANESAEQEPSFSDARPSGTSTRTKVMIYFCFCLAIVCILQGIIIGMVVEDKGEDNGNDSNGKRSAGTNSLSTPSPTPSIGGTPATADSPTTTVASPASYSFQSIASAPGAFRIEEVSTCDDCTVTIYPPGPTDLLQWSSVATITEVAIHSNGFFELNCQLYGVCGMIELTGSLDLAPNVNGNIYALWGKEEPRRRRRRKLVDDSTVSNEKQQSLDPNLITTLTLSWEGVNLYGYDSTRRYRVNAQVKVSKEEIVFCYGLGDVNGAGFRSGILNYTNGSEYSPVTLTGFDQYGYSTTFPSNECEVMILG